MLKQFVQGSLRRMGRVLVPADTWDRLTGLPPDLATDKEFLELYERCKPFTMTSIEKLFALYRSVEYCVRNGIDGAFVECGVWRGGSAMMMALASKHFGSIERQIILYDTFEGMSEPSAVDRTFEGRNASDLLESTDPTAGRNVWCCATLEEVRRNLASCDYPQDRISYVRGKVEDTVPTNVPPAISLLRLDTDWYESTRHELVHLYPLVAERGILILDDYGHWLGARKAVDEFFSGREEAPLLNRVDFSCRLVVRA